MGLWTGTVYFAGRKGGIRLTEKELTQIHYINIEIKHIKEELQRLEGKSMVKGQEITGMPAPNGTSDKVADYATEKAELEMMLDMALKRLYLTRNQVERFLQGIEDNEIRLIVRMRAINCMNWYQIGEEIGMERTTVSKKYRNFLKDSH